MRANNTSVDGLVPRRPRTIIGQTQNNAQDLTRKVSGRRELMTAAGNAAIAASAPRVGGGIRRSDLTESLRQIDDPTAGANSSGRRKRGLEDKLQSRRKAKRIAKAVLIVLLVAALGIAGFLGFKALTATNNVFRGGIFGIAQSAPLKTDADGRSNFLVLGTTDDDPNHSGGNLTDSMMIISIDQTKHNAFIVSVPRDLFVQYGRSCVSGMSGKINVYFSCVNDGSTDAEEQARLAATQAFVGQIYGIDLQYGIHVNSKVLPQAVDAVGGIDVDIEGSGGAPGILDRNFDWGCNYTCYKVKYTNGVHHLDGSAASFLSMARGDTAPTYGLANSNFDREKNQQKIIIALKDKATSTGTLTDISKVTGLLDAIGNNLRTNIQTSEIRTLASTASKIQSSDIRTLSLIGGDAPIMTTSNVFGQSVVVPSAGTYDYSQLQALIRSIGAGDTSVLEGATVGVYNGSQTPGVAATKAAELKKAGFTVIATDDAQNDYTAAVTLYDQTGGKKPATLAKLEKQLGVKVTAGKPADFTSDADFVVVLGTPKAAAQSAQ